MTKKQRRRLPGQAALESGEWAKIPYRLPPSPSTRELEEEEQRAVDEDYKEMMEADRQQRLAQVNIAKHLRILRLSLDLHQSDMAQRLGVALKSWQMYERGEIAVPSGVVARIYSLFDVDLHALFVGRPRGLTPDERAEFSDFVAAVTDHIAARFPDLTEDQRVALRRKYVKSSEGHEIDGDLMFQCYESLIKAEFDEDDSEPNNN